jgi:hypothetical protein
MLSFYVDTHLGEKYESYVHSFCHLHQSKVYNLVFNQRDRVAKDVNDYTVVLHKHSTKKTGFFVFNEGPD